MILSCGAVGSPHLLQCSGVGPAPLLAAHGIARDAGLVLDRPGVGANLHDHLQIRSVYRLKEGSTTTLNDLYKSWLEKIKMGLEYIISRRGPISMAPSQLGAFLKSDASVPTPDLQVRCCCMNRRALLRDVTQLTPNLSPIFSTVPRPAPVTRKVWRPSPRFPRSNSGGVQSAPNLTRYRYTHQRGLSHPS